MNIEQLVKDVMDGNESPFRALFYLKKQMKALKLAAEIVEIEGFNQSEYEDKKFIKQGYEVEKRSGGKLWNFKKCKSYSIAKDNLTEIEDTLKAAYLANEKGLSMIDENAEIVELPIVTFKKDSLIIKKL